MPRADHVPEPAVDAFDDLAAANVVVFWRRGCGFCMLLRRGLRKAGVATVEVDIWEDPAAAAFVRRHARGNETVPTVAVAGEVMVNPSTGSVVAAARAAGLGAAG
jgi:mycoredoxin